MATDATGTPTSLGIPTYNPDVDAPSGLGFNAAMEAINNLIDARMSAPSSPSTGDVPVWNGSTWVKSSTTKMAVAGLAPGTNGQVLTTSGGATGWATPSTTQTYELIAESVLGSNGQFDFTSISSAYRHLHVFWSLRSNNAVTNESAWVRFNGFSANYDWFHITVNTGGAVSGGAGGPVAEGLIGYATGSSATAGYFAQGQFFIPNYVGGSTRAPEYTGTYSNRQAGAGTVGGLYRNATHTVDRIQIIRAAAAGGATAWATGSVVQIYGIR